MFPRTLSGPLALALVPLLAGLAPAQTALRMKFQKDQSSTYEMVQQMKMSMQVQGKNIDTDMRQTVVMTMKVLEVLDNGNARIKMKFDHVRMEMKGVPGIGDVDIDSRKDEVPNNPLGQLLGGLVKALGKAEFDTVMSPRGETVEFKLPDDLVKEFQSLPGSAQMGDFFSEKGLKNMMGQSGMVLPRDPVKKGDTWSHKVSMKMPFGKFETDMKYTYQGPETVDGKKLEKITFEPKTAIEPDPNAPFAMKVDGQKGEGTVYFDPQAGRMQEMQLNQVTELTMTVANMNINQKMDQTVTMKLKGR